MGDPSNCVGRKKSEFAGFLASLRVTIMLRLSNFVSGSVDHVFGLRITWPMTSIISALCTAPISIEDF